MMKIKHVVFDWDGTLADTYPVISAAYDYTFRALGLTPIPYDEVKRITSTLQNKDTMGHIFGDRKEEAKKAYYEYIEKYHANNLEAMPNAAELLKTCEQQGLRSYLLTNKKRLYVLEETDKLGFTRFFTNIVAAGDFAEDKPHPLATRAVFSALPEAKSILVIGDGVADYEVARTYDCGDAKALCFIYDPKDKYHGEQPDKIVKDFAEIIAFLKEENADA